MKNERFDFQIAEAGCLIWLAPKRLGGVSPQEFYEIFAGEGNETLQEFVTRGAMMAMSLYQDDGYVVRFVCDDLSAQEAAEWTARAHWQLDLACGELLVSGILDPDIERWLAEFE